MGKARNVLFIMCDQLRADHLSCAGHPHLQTPAIDGLAARGVRFPRAYVQSGVCGPSRMSTYTGRYSMSHGATWNFVPLPVGEYTLGDYLRPHGVRTAIISGRKTPVVERRAQNLGIQHLYQGREDKLVVLDELLRRITDYDIDPEGARRVHSANVRGFAHLPTTVVPR